MDIPFARELAAICRADAEEYDDHDPAGLEVLENLCRPGNEPIFEAYQALSEHKALDRYLIDRPYQAIWLRELARCIDRGEPSDEVLYPDLV
jgi:hypothetical protein